MFLLLDLPASFFEHVLVELPRLGLAELVNNLELLERPLRVLDK